MGEKEYSFHARLGKRTCHLIIPPWGFLVQGKTYGPEKKEHLSKIGAEGENNQRCSTGGGGKGGSEG